MRVLVACKRGNISERDKYGHCLCADCKEFRADRQRARGVTPAKRKWIAENKVKVAGYSTKWNSENKSMRRSIVNAWRKANPEKVAAMNAKGGKKWSSNNKGLRLASVRARQLAKRLRTPAWADLGRISEIYKKASNMTKESGIPYEVDHILPLQGETVSGLHVSWNLQILKRSENRSKGIKVCAV